MRRRRNGICRYAYDVVLVASQRRWASVTFQESRKDIEARNASLSVVGGLFR